jgi:hypothetical protein
MRRSLRKFLAIATACAAAAALSGCVFIETQSSAQLDGIGKVQITTRAGGDADGRTVQLLLAYRFPSNAAAPESIATTATSGSPGFTFSLSPSFTSELQAKSPAASGQQWVGYISPALTSPNGRGTFTVSPSFSLLQSSNGSPFQGPFDYRTVVGFRSIDGTHPASRPVLCASPITGTADNGVCATDPNAATIATNLRQSTQDLGILDAPGTESVNQGNVLRVKFGVEFAGDGNPAPTFDLSASTDIPGGIVEPSTPILTPDDGVALLRAITQVPVDTPPGHYDVTLTATLPGGETRSSTHDVLVTPTTVRCSEYAPTIAGTPGDDVLVGTSGPDVIAGYAGNDQILGLGGNDVVCAGRGDDILRGGAGNDKLAGRRGNDLLTGGSGRNVIDPGPGKDQMIQ